MPRITSKTIALDCESNGLDVFHGARPFLVTICDEDGEQQRWEWSVDPLTRKVTIPGEDKEQIRQVVEEADRIVGQNLKFDVAMLREAGVVEDWPWHKTEDTLVAGHLLRSNQSHELKVMALVYLGINIQPFEDEMEKMVKKARLWARKHRPEWRIAKEGLPEMPSARGDLWKSDMWLLQHYEDGKHYDLVRTYANADSAVTVQLWAVFEEKIKAEGLWEIYRESMKIPAVLVDMERRGVTVSGSRLEEQVNKYGKESVRLGKLCCAIARTYGYDLQLPKSGNNGSLSKFLFGESGGKGEPDDYIPWLDLPVVAESKKTGVPTFDKAVVEHYLATLDPDGKQHRFVQALSDKRKRDTAVQYMIGYKRFWLPSYRDHNMRQTDWYVLHPSLNQTGTDTLRMSSSNPNEQNISAKEGFNLRYSFGPAPGREWWSLDYQNIELRIPAYASGEKKMIDLFERPDEPPYFGSYHLLNCSIVYPDLFWPLAEREGEFKRVHVKWYKRGKNGGFAIQYGCQEAKADATFGVRGAFRQIKESLKDVARYTQETIEFANKHGYVETLPDRTLGCERGYPLWCTRSSWGGVSPTIPLSYKVQGTAMWATRKAMVRCGDYLRELSLETSQDYRIAMQVHDEIVFDFPAGGRKNLPKVRRLQKLMELSGDDIGIPLKVAATYHPGNWSEEGKC